MQFRKLHIIIFAIGLVGAVITFSIDAATRSISVQPELATQQQTANTCSDTGSDGGKYVVFGSNNCGDPHNPPSDFFSFGEFSLKNPTHFDDTYHHFPSVQNGFHQLEFTVKTTGPTSTDGYYWSQTFYWQNPDPGPEFDGGYFGIQNFSLPHNNQPIAIFSIWNATNAESDGYVVSFTGEGQGRSVRLPINWASGKTYRTWVEKSSDQRGSPADKVWWDGYIQELPEGTTKLIGSIETPADWGNITSNVTVTFHERYTGPINNTCPVQASSGEFTNIMANNGLFRPRLMRHGSYQIPECIGKYNVNNIDNGYKSQIGN